MAGYDERDTLFSRMELKPGTANYGDYYERNPRRKEADDAFRAWPNDYTDDLPVRSLIDSTFGLLEGIRPLARAPAGGLKQEITPDEATAILKSCAMSYGAVLFGTGQLGEACFYSTRGRGAEYGQAPKLPGDHGASSRQGLVFAVRMNPEEMAAAPAPRAAAEVVNGYARVALIGLVLAQCIRGWGWEASCTMDGRADVVLPVAARFAGIGSIGRSGLLLTDEYGPCVRLGAVVTDMPLGRTARKPCSAAKLCNACNRCAALCPALAIDDAMSGPTSADRRQFKPVNDDACFGQWKKCGTDCGLCIANCPLSKITI